MKKSRSYLLMILGIVLIIIGLYLIKYLAEPSKTLLTLAYILIGIGCGTFGQSTGDIISHKAIKKYPEMQKNIEIEKNDERNIKLNNKAKAKAFDIMIFVYGAMLLAFALMGSIELSSLLLLVFAYLFIIGIQVYYFSKYSKEM